MLEKPSLPEALLITRLQEEYGLEVARLDFLPLGVDVNAAVYRVEAAEGKAYFLKLRKGDFDELTALLPRFLHSQGIRQVIAPLETRLGLLWGDVDGFKMLLYPYIEGRDGYEVALTAAQWREFGAALRAIHAARLPPELLQRLPRESYSSHGRERVRAFQAQVESSDFNDPSAAKLAASMRAHREVIDHLVRRADELGLALHSRSLEPVLCHSDIHPGNLLIGAELYIVDWDAPILAPKERDLLLIGGCYTWSSREAVERFYQGYGQANIDLIALAYYRYERIIQDIAEFCQQILASDEGGEDREQGLRYFNSNFLPGHEVELARLADEAVLRQG